MGKLRLDMAKPGMKLTAPVYNPHGKLLLGAGVELTQRHISILKSWGVTEVEVDCQDGLNGEKIHREQLDDQTFRSIGELLDRKFCEVLDGEVMMEIMRVARKHALKRALAQSGEVGSDGIA